MLGFWISGEFWVGVKTMIGNSHSALTVAGNVRAAVLPASPRRRLYLWQKLIIEWLVALVLTVLVSPLLVVLALAVRLTSPGPAFYAQSRLGLRGRVFRIIKLRTMADKCEAASGPVWSLPGDKRVTRIGRILRDTHLDELPQLLNVLKGDMGLVGPRPERPEISARIERSLPQFRARLQVMPGVTGLAQMRLPADSDLAGVRLKLAHDLYYIREIGFVVDVRIAFSTGFYFLGAVAKAAHNAMVKSYGIRLEQSPQLLPELCGEQIEVGVSEV
jgi:lipopolysaccharide/colanic/teichoic acid biosynthesis glycosyltransferase